MKLLPYTARTSVTPYCFSVSEASGPAAVVGSSAMASHPDDLGDPGCLVQPTRGHFTTELNPLPPFWTCGTKNRGVYEMPTCADLASAGQKLGGLTGLQGRYRRKSSGCQDDDSSPVISPMRRLEYRFLISASRWLLPGGVNRNKENMVAAFSSCYVHQETFFFFCGDLTKNGFL